MHSYAGPAFCDPEHSVWAWHGTLVPQDVIEEPAEINAAAINAERSEDIRRVMTEMYACWRFRENCRPVAADEFGTLYSSPFERDEPLVMLCERERDPTKNANEQPWIRVPPSVTTPREAVAWTFGKPENYFDAELDS
ncbi:MAG: hypothetical protein HY735_05045 [Verrucomicrobia bacterium]|nr:hypothetical protein [Verrucomicrobiota bacterium]